MRTSHSSDEWLKPIWWLLAIIGVIAAFGFSFMSLAAFQGIELNCPSGSDCSDATAAFKLNSVLAVAGLVILVFSAFRIRKIGSARSGPKVWPETLS